jgi:hypothetical protein
MTPDEIKEIQKNGIDWLGNPLVVDGKLGAKTNWWMGISSLSAKRQDVGRLVLGYHASNIVFEETGKNDSPFVDMLFKPVGLQQKGYPWCAALVSHCLRKCKVEAPYLVSAYAFIEWAKGTSKLYPNHQGSLIVQDPLPFDIEAFLYPRKPGDTEFKGHVRFVTGYDSVTKRSAGVDGNVQNSIRAGERHDRPERYFIRIPGMGTEHGPLQYPTKLVDLDQLGDR